MSLYWRGCNIAASNENRVSEHIANGVLLLIIQTSVVERRAQDTRTSGSGILAWFALGSIWEFPKIGGR